MPDLPGYKLGKRITQLPGVEVYEGHRLEDGAHVLIKMSSPDSDPSEVFARFKHEHEVRSALELDRIVKTVDLTRHDGRVVLIAEHFDGISLRQVMDKHWLTLLDRVALAEQTARAIDEIHRAGLLHKDIGPDSILYHHESRVTKLANFGDATYLRNDSLPSLEQRMRRGVLPYISPEQTGRMNRTVDSRTDLYALGATLYELFSGSPPFTGSDLLQLVHAHLASTPEPLREANPKLPEILCEIVMKLLAKSPDDRYQTASGVADDLARCVKELRETGSVERFELARNDARFQFELPDKLYGREQDLTRLLEIFERVSKGSVEAVLITGDNGKGKTSFVNEASIQLIRAQAYFVSGRFDTFSRDVPFSALVSALEKLIQQLLTESEQRLAEWRRRILDAVHGNGQVVIDVLPSLELILGPQPVVPELDAVEAQNRFKLTFLNFIQVFCDRRHPLVLFLDDTQWADSASLSLISMMLTAQNVESLMFIMTFRKDATGAGRAFLNTIEEQRGRGARIESMALEPLSAEAVTELVADTLRQSRAEAEALATTIWRKTGGNPFFVRKFLQTLYERGLISLEPGTRCFVCDVEAAKSEEITDNVAEVLVNNLTRLPDETRRALSIAAAIGGRFDLETVAQVAGGRTEDVAAALTVAVREAFIAPRSQLEALDPERLDSPLVHERYAFQHDRVQQAAYSLVPDSERPLLHLQIGRALSTQSARSDRDDHLFEIVNQMNEGAAHIDDPDERAELVARDLTAARRARASTAYAIAVRCLKMAIELLGTDAWSSDYETVYEATSSLAESLSLKMDFDEALKTLDLALDNSRSTVDTAKLHTLQINVFTAMGALVEASECALAAARKLGLELPECPDELERQLQAEIQVILERISRQEIESFVDLPRMKDPEKTTLMALLMYSQPSMYQTDQKLFSLVCCKMVTLSLEHGNCAVSGKGYGSLAVILGGVLGRYRDSYRFGKLGVELTHRFEHMGGLAAAYFVWAMFASAWTRPMQESLDLYEQSIKYGLQSGDHTHACYSAARYTTHEAFMGKPIAEALTRAEENQKLLYRLGDRVNLSILATRIQLFKWLQGKTPEHASLDGEGFSEEAWRADVHSTGSLSMISHFAILRLMHRYLCGDFEGAYAFARESEETLPGSTGMIVVADYNFYYSLTVAALYDEASASQREELDEVLARNQEQMRSWADSCAENFQQLYLLVEAERARSQDDALEAMELYDLAIAAADTHGFPHIEGLACELAGRFWARRNKSTFAATYFDRARAAYRIWGATRLLQRLRQDRSEHSSDAENESKHALGHEAAQNSRSLDLAAVLKATSALSGEIILERLLETLMNIILENAGADHGSLILKSEEGFLVQAYKHPGAPEPVVMTELSIDDSPHLSNGIVNYVTRTGELVVLDDAQQSEFRSDPYVVESETKSVLCAPIVHQGNLVGALYVENTLVAGAFTPDRVEGLTILISQIAISIQNATLFARQERQTQELKRYRDRLEDLVKERTHELENAQGRLLDMSRKAGMAEVASGVLHNVGNVLNSVNVGTSMVRDEVRAMRIEAVAKLSDLLEEHSDNLAEFLSRDPKGRRVPEYVAKLAKKLRDDQTKVLRSLQQVGEHLEHMKNVIAAQQGYSRVATVKEKCLLQNIFESALEISNAALVNRGIRVVREFEDLPPLPVDRHQVLQIVVNLISNAKHALEHSKSDDRVLTLGLNMIDDDQVCLAVEDNGIGIKPEHMKHIFMHGFTTKRNGNGFGLHNCANAAQQMGGTMLVQSDGENRGAKFTLQIPVAQEKPAIREASL